MPDHHDTNVSLTATVRYCTLKLLSPDLVEMVECSTPETEAADGPLCRCCTNWLMASSLP